MADTNTVPHSLTVIRSTAYYTYSEGRLKSYGRFNPRQLKINGGWVEFRLEPSQEKVESPEYVKVIMDKNDGERQYFTLMDGEHAGKDASIALEGKNHSEYLINRVRYDEAIEIKIQAKVFDISQGKIRDRKYSDVNGKHYNQLLADLTYGGKTGMTPITTVEITLDSNENDEYYPLPAGRYKILIPDFPHGKAEKYHKNYHQVWFPIEYNGIKTESYIHVGHASEGCVTVIETEKWGELYQYLISHRMPNDPKYIGTLVINYPFEVRRREKFLEL